MILGLPILILAMAIISLPAYLYARKKTQESVWLLFATIPSLLFWIVLIAAGYGAQSLGNFIEFAWLIGIAIVLLYVKVFVVNSRVASAKQATYGLIALLCLIALMLRTFMPILPGH